MRHDEYMQEIQRTWQADGLTEREQICNATLGLVGEAGEYHRDPTPDELGDVLFYACTLARLVDADCSRGRALAVESDCLIYMAGAIAEKVKKRAFHGKQNGAELRADVADMVASIEALAGDDPEVCTAEWLRGQNIAKLRARHPNGWATGYNSAGVSNE